MKKQFIVGKKYVGHGIYGTNTVTITKVTQKTVTFDHESGTNRAKLRDYYLNSEAFSFRAWLFQA